MSKAIAVDLDGCVANFTRAFSTQAFTLYPDAPIVNQKDVTSWSWHEWYMGGGTRAREVIEGTWDYINKNPQFWLTPEPLFPKQMVDVRAMSREQPLVFVTRRGYKDDRAFYFTQQWLAMQNIPTPLVRTVRAGEEKEAFLTDMGIRVIIEDSPMYVPGLLSAGINVVLITWLYNRDVVDTGKYGEQGLYRVNDLRNALSFAKDIAERPNSW